MSCAIYRNKSDNKISKIEKITGDYTPEKLEILVQTFNNKDNDRTVELSNNNIISEIIEYLENTKQLQDNWESAIKKELLEQIERTQYELNDLESFVNNFEEQKS